MSDPADRAPWALARSAQAAVGAATLADALRLLGGQSWSSRAFVIVMTAAMVLFLVWFSRCRRIAGLLMPDKAPVPPVWAVIAWLVPVVNLWVPRGLVLQVHRASAPGDAEDRDRSVVNAWWAAWVGHALVATLTTRPGGSTPFVLTLATVVLELAAAVLAIVVIQRVTSRQAVALNSISAGRGPSR
ncbi:DUF4328 domain-containing protein [Streptomyces sp. NPDC048106]|uniref:DUF4328 domain-containing protein n=1 Tax=Streptomyces sp. NPDC048106 TaxID=3155750 RepID=UPI0034563640